MTPKEAEKKYGKKKWKKIENKLYGVTCAILPNGEMDIPQIDIDNAIKELNGEYVGDWD